MNLDDSEKDKRVRRTHTYNSSAVYEGEWLKNKRSGRGIQTWVDGTRYEGTVYIQNKTKYLQVNGKTIEQMVMAS